MTKRRVMIDIIATLSFFVILVMMLFGAVNGARQEDYKNYVPFSALTAVPLHDVTYRDDATNGKSIDGIAGKNQKVHINDLSEVPKSFKDVKTATVYESADKTFYASKADYDDAVPSPHNNSGYVSLYVFGGLGILFATARMGNLVDTIYISKQKGQQE